MALLVVNEARVFFRVTRDDETFFFFFIVIISGCFCERIELFVSLLAASQCASVHMGICKVICNVLKL